MTSFIGRKRELAKLGTLLDKKSPALIVVKGRRRIGKSRLLSEFGKLVCYLRLADRKLRLK